MNNIYKKLQFSKQLVTSWINITRNVPDLQVTLGVVAKLFSAN